MVNIPKEIEKNLKKEVTAQYSKSSEEMGSMLKSVFQSFIQNDPSLGKKVQALKESLATFAVVYDALLAITCLFYSERTTEEEVESKLNELELNKGFVELYVSNYGKFIDYMETPEAAANTASIGQYRLIGFKWRFDEAIYDTGMEIPKTKRVVGELIYLDTWTGSVKGYKCLVPFEMAEQIQRETFLALSSCKHLKEAEA